MLVIFDLGDLTDLGNLNDLSNLMVFKGVHTSAAICTQYTFK